MRIFSINKTGHSHTECEDAVIVDTFANCAFVFDGVSNSRYGGQGAHYLARKYQEAFSRADAREYVTVQKPENIRKYVYGICCESLKAACSEFNCTPGDLATTSLMVIVYNDIVTVIHSGDGTIFGFSENEQSSPMILSYPDNSDNHYVYSAESPLQLNRMRAVHLRQSDLKGLLLSTDGFSDKFIRPFQSGFDGFGISRAFDAINSNDDLQTLVNEKHLSRPAISDDISAVVIKFDNAVTYDRQLPTAPSVIPSGETVLHPEQKGADVAGKPAKAAPAEHAHTGNRRSGLGIAVFLIVLSLIISLFTTIFMVKRQARRLDDSSAAISSLSQEVVSLNDRLNTTEQSTSEETKTVTEATETTDSVSDESDSDNNSTAQTSSDETPSEASEDEPNVTQESEQTSEDGQKSLRVFADAEGVRTENGG